jgi:LPXTG-site transpeptidase (sortase) family protein
MSLIPKNNNDTPPKKQAPGSALGHRRGRTIQPLSANLKLSNYAHAALSRGSQKASPAVELIRRKLDDLYAREPSAKQEIATTQTAASGTHYTSKHQQFMYELSISGKPLAEIQTAWHNYYVQLPDKEKHEVWQEFYDANDHRPSAYSQFVKSQQPAPQPGAAATPPPHIPHTAEEGTAQSPIVVADHGPTAAQLGSRKTVADVKKQLLKRVATNSHTQLKAKHHIQSLAFGLGLGSFVILIFLFGFFNEIIIAPLIQPSRNDQNTPIILDTSDVAPSPNPQVIIPKINVQIPVIYNESSITDADVENSLEDGVLHYPTTVDPGQDGNAAFFGHSSNNILNSGKYKFAFVLLHTLVPGDIFYLTYHNTLYAYKVYNREVVSPNDVSVLDNVPGKTATATLITCDPPGTSINRLVVWGEQISPSPSTDTAPTQTITPAEQPTQLANDGPTLWGRLTQWVIHIF